MQFCRHIFLISLFIVSISSNSIPSQCESLVDAVVVDELDLESPIRVEGQSTPREHQVDLELVGWGQDEIENHQDYKKTDVQHEAHSSRMDQI